MKPAAYVNPRAAEVVELRNERSWIHHDPCANNRVLTRTQNSTGDQLQDKAAAVVNDRVTRIVASGAARDAIKRSRHIIDDFPLAFIAPLGSDHYDRFHSC